MCKKIIGNMVAKPHKQPGRGQETLPEKHYNGIIDYGGIHRGREKEEGQKTPVIEFGKRSKQERWETPGTQSLGLPKTE